MWQTNGLRTFQKRYDSGVWVRIHPKTNGTFEVRASSIASNSSYVESNFACMEDAMEFSDREFANG